MRGNRESIRQLLSHITWRGKPLTTTSRGTDLRLGYSLSVALPVDVSDPIIRANTHEATEITLVDRLIRSLDS
jgi:hypothetical protein